MNGLWTAGAGQAQQGEKGWFVVNVVIMTGLRRLRLVSFIFPSMVFGPMLSLARLAAAGRRKIINISPLCEGVNIMPGASAPLTPMGAHQFYGSRAKHGDWLEISVFEISCLSPAFAAPLLISFRKTDEHPTPMPANLEIFPPMCSNHIMEVLMNMSSPKNIIIISNFIANVNHDALPDEGEADG